MGLFFFLIHVIVQFDFVPGVLFAELGFGTLVQRFRKLWLQFLLGAFPGAGPEMGAAKHAAPFRLKTPKAFNMHLNTPFFGRPCFKPPCFAIDNL